MDKKKGAAILVIIAIVLAITAISLNMMDSDVKTSGNSVRDFSGTGDVGVTIIPGNVEDKSIETGESP